MFSNFLKVLGIQGEQQGTQSTSKPATTTPNRPISPTPTADKPLASQLNEDDEEVPKPGPQKELKTYKGEVQEDADLFVEESTSPAASPPSSTSKKGVASKHGQPDLFKQDDEESWLFLESQKAVRASVAYARPEFAEKEGLSHFF